MTDRPRALDTFTVVATAWTLALSYPLLELLGRNIEFFIAHDATRADVVLFGVLVAVALPAALAALVVVLARVHDGVGVALLAVIVTSLVAALALQVLDVLPVVRDWPSAALIAVAILGGGGLTVAYLRSDAFRRVVRMGAVLPLVALGVFALLSPAAGLIRPSTASSSGVELARPAPVVVVIFDELPASTLMTREGEIDAALFPNFARLAATSTWYRNTTTVANYSSSAVPAILDGRIPVRGTAPTADGHPDNVFTMLADGYDVRALELITRMCVAPCTTALARPEFGPRWSRILEDAGVVLGHVVLPARARAALPAIDENWRDFRGGELDEGSDPRFVVQGNHAGVFREYIAALASAPGRTAHVLHSHLPHNPWRYAPTGQRYFGSATLPGSAPGDAHGRRWLDDDWNVAQAYQRHILQVQFVDVLLGELLDRLEQTGTFDETLFVLTSDHGVSFFPGSHRRGVTGPAQSAVAWVPLFVKEPEQVEGVVDDRAAQTIDIVPTVLDLLGAEALPASLEGRPLAEIPSERDRTIVDATATEDQPWGSPVDEGRGPAEVVAYKYGLFPSSGTSLDPWGLAPAEARDLLGRAPSDLAPQRSGETFTLVEAGRYASVDLDGEMLPLFVRGSVSGDGGVVAIAVNGTIVAATRTYLTSGVQTFAAMIPPTSLERRGNRIGALLVEPGEPPTLRRLERVP